MPTPATTATLPAAPAPPPPAPAAGSPPEVWRTIFHIAWLAILLGLAIEALLLLAAAGFGTLGSPSPVVADLVQKVSWSFLVCVSIGFGNVVMRTKPLLVGATGLLAAPLAFAVAKTLHKSAGAALGVAAAGGPSPLLIAGIKAVQYGLFGWLVARLGTRPSPAAHAGIGFATGVVFGGAILAVTAMASPAPVAAGAMVARGINEVLFPVGCGVALWTADALVQARR